MTWLYSCPTRNISFKIKWAAEALTGQGAFDAHKKIIRGEYHHQIIFDIRRRVCLAQDTKGCYETIQSRYNTERSKITFSKCSN